jgi:putative zinc finger protein/HEAT repeat protein
MINCKELEENLTLYQCDELPPDQRAALEAHVRECAPCRARLEDAQRVAEFLRERNAREPSPELLVRCRQALDEALDREELGWRGLVPRWVAGFDALPTSRVISTLTILVLGFGLGWTLRSRPSEFSTVPSSLAPASFVGDLDNIKDISRVAPDPRTGGVRITFDAERRVTLEGSLDDPRIQEVLVNAVKGYANPGIRRDMLDALQAGSNHPNLRQALLYAVGHDPNLGVRLRALHAVWELGWGLDARAVLLDVVEHDRNAGLRGAAIELLSSHPDEVVLSAFERLATTDASRYVRLRCANTVREVEAR